MHEHASVYAIIHRRTALTLEDLIIKRLVGIQSSDASNEIITRKILDEKDVGALTAKDPTNEQDFR